ncbi:MAG: Uncharacterised protein [Formosa sp. Hel1_33_131]|jgi:hypothetical protein|nr:MAG: Uncharacterised protein [Formosa sp. Hel1_33_131]
MIIVETRFIRKIEEMIPNYQKSIKPLETTTKPTTLLAIWN